MLTGHFGAGAGLDALANSTDVELLKTYLRTVKDMLEFVR